VRRATTLLLALLVFGGVAAPLLGEAQPSPKTPQIGIITPVAVRSAPQFVAFEERLRELGWADTRNVVIDFRRPDNADDLPGAAAELVKKKVDVILATGPEAPLKAARQATTMIPIVMIAVNYDPVERGYVAALARPGGNITGVFFRGLEVGPKQLQLLKEALPKAARLAVLWEPFSADQLTAIEAAARTLKVELHKVKVSPPYDLDAAFARVKAARVGGLLVVGSPVFLRERARISELVLKHRLPTMSGVGITPETDAAILLRYGPRLTDLFRRAADYVDRILRGTAPADLPVEQAAKFEFVINLKAARQLGVTLPQTLVQRADRIIE
jgi:putative ABC transport system substrate-binding protein